MEGNLAEPVAVSEPVVEKVKKGKKAEKPAVNEHVAEAQKLIAQKGLNAASLEALKRLRFSREGGAEFADAVLARLESKVGKVEARKAA